MPRKRVKIHKLKYNDYYLCPNCKIFEVTQVFQRCPRCGADIEWVELKK